MLDAIKKQMIAVVRNKKNHGRRCRHKPFMSLHLRKWFGHKEERWQEFKSRYLKELKEKNEILEQLIDLGKNKKVTLLYAAKDEEINNAQVLLEVLKNK